LNKFVSLGKNVRVSRARPRDLFHGLVPFAKLSQRLQQGLKGPVLLIEAKPSRLEINPPRAQELKALAKDVLSQLKDLVARMNRLMGK
jgi:hypothetical protein